MRRSGRRHRRLALVLGLVAGCSAGAGLQPPGAPFESGPMRTSDGTILVEWQQAIAGPGGVDVYLSAPDDPGRACHLASAAGGLSFHCENHAQTIEVAGIDLAETHTVTVSLLRGANATALAVTQGGRTAPQSRGRVVGTPGIAAGEQLRVQLATRGDAGASIGRFRIEELD